MGVAWTYQTCGVSVGVAGFPRDWSVDAQEEMEVVPSTNGMVVRPLSSPERSSEALSAGSAGTTHDQKNGSQVYSTRSRMFAMVRSLELAVHMAVCAQPVTESRLVIERSPDLNSASEYALCPHKANARRPVTVRCVSNTEIAK